MELDTLSESEQELYDIFIEESQDLYGSKLRIDAASGTHETAMLFARVLNRVLDENGDHIERQAARKVREMEREEQDNVLSRGVTE